jgi:hypothetical protein
MEVFGKTMQAQTPLSDFGNWQKVTTESFGKHFRHLANMVSRVKGQVSKIKFRGYCKQHGGVQKAL